MQNSGRHPVHERFGKFSLRVPMKGTVCGVLMSLCCSQGHGGHFRLSVCLLYSAWAESWSELIVSYMGKVCSYKLPTVTGVSCSFMWTARTSCLVCGSVLVWHFLFRRDTCITGEPQESSKMSAKLYCLSI